MKNFWKQLNKPIFILAPMDDVTETVFRQVITSCAKPDVFFTEFTNVEGMLSEGAEHVMQRLKYSEIERPIVAQIWGMNPENFYKAAKILVDMGFDGIDINMGCPERTVVKRGCCSALIENHPLALEMIDATIKGAGGLPVSVKTRLGLKQWKTEEWISFLLKTGIDVLTVHARLASEMSNFPARWDEIKKVVELRDTLAPDVLVIGNGDITNYQDGVSKVQEFGVDGVMIGRGIFKDPWAFDKNPHQHSLNENLAKLLEHAELFESTWGRKKNFQGLRKFFKAYIHGFEGASDLRSQLMETKNLQDVKDALQAHTRLFSR